MASFGFSVGDFITCLSLIRQVTQALKDSKGSVYDYKSFLQTLNSLNQTFTTSELVYLQWQNHSRQSCSAYENNTVAMINGILYERLQCKNLMERFLKSTKLYTDAFLMQREKVVVRGWRKITWLFEKEEISKLDRDLQGHMRAMQIYTDALFQYGISFYFKAC
jgi:hypothetical protein